MTQSKIWMISMLLIMAVICSSALALVSIVTTPTINRNQEITKMEMVLGVFGITYNEKAPDSVFSIYNERITGGEQNGLTVYTDKETGGKAILMSGGGFQGNITVVVAVNGTKISGFKVVSQVETPGLGARISEPGFQESFVGKEISSGIKLVKGGNAGENEFDAITGATETSRALEKILDKGFGTYFGKAGE